MEKVLNTVSTSYADNIVVNEADFNLKTTYEKDEEQIGDDFLELNKVSTDDAEILEEPKRLNGVYGIEGELIMSQSKDIRWSIDNDGTLYLADYAPDKYYIDEMGDLILNL
jgi:hypothetical protein